MSDSDPQRVGLPPKEVTASVSGAESTARLVNGFVAKARQILAGHHPANMLLLRGFSQHPTIPTMSEIYKLKAAAIASYPMYRGLAKLAGMTVLPTGATVEDEFATLKQNYADFDFFFIHIKGADSAGEDGDFDRKVRVIEQVDRALPELVNLQPDVIIVTGDHSTPAVLKSHSWHPVPVLLHSQFVRPDGGRFAERDCRTGGLGRLPSIHLMPLAMGYAQKLARFGA